MATGKRFPRDLFEIENARNLTRDELVATFVPTKAFRRLLSAKNHVVLGSRGSGKTALAKALSHDHLSRLDDQMSREVIRSRSFIGIYVPTKLEWVGGLRNKPWQSEAEKELFFQWRLNVATCMAFLTTLRSCLEAYMPNKAQRAKVEAELVSEVGISWAGHSSTGNTIGALQTFLEDIEYEKQQQLARTRALGHLRDGEEPVGIGFGADLFVPLRRGMKLAARALCLPLDCTWLLCLDEAEFLDEMHHRILNSHLRTHSDNLFFKITTMPYCHYTLATNTKVSLNVGQDFEYVYIDQDPVVHAGHEGVEGHQFAGAIFNKRALVSGRKYRDLSLREMLGGSVLLDSKRAEDWGPRSENLSLLRRYASRETIERAEKLSVNQKEFMDQIGRKMHGALRLRHAVATQTGRKELTVYSGDTMAIRCGDANPRRLIRIFNSFLLAAKWQHSPGRTAVVRLRPNVQTRILTGFSTSTLSRVQSEEVNGPELYEFLKRIGDYMHDSLHNEPLTTDQISSVRVDRTVDDLSWMLTKMAVGLGLLFPNTNANYPDEMPEREGTFRFAYVLAPHFRILPRKGKARKLETILRRHRGKVAPAFQGEQMALAFLSGDED